MLNGLSFDFSWWLVVWGWGLEGLDGGYFLGGSKLANMSTLLDAALEGKLRGVSWVGFWKKSCYFLGCETGWDCCFCGIGCWTGGGWRLGGFYSYYESS